MDGAGIFAADVFLKPTLIRNLDMESIHKRQSEAPRPQRGASRTRSGERKASKRNTVLVVLLDPAYIAGLAGHLPIMMSSI